VALSACGSELSMIAGGPGGRRIPQVPRGGVHGVGDASRGKWGRDLTRGQWFPDFAFTARPSSHNCLEACCRD
jgi:hypothetical protein